MKKPAPLYASKPRFGLGSLAALVFVAAFGVAAIVFGMNALQNTTPAAPAQPIAVTMDATFTAVPAAIAATQPAVAAPTELPTEAPIEMPAVAPTDAPTLVPTEAPPATATVEPTIAPSPTNADKPTATPRPTRAPAATATIAPTPATLGTGETVTYTVQGGDTCGKIAKQFGVTVAQIIQLNNLDERCFLNVGKVLTIKK